MTNYGNNAPPIGTIIGYGGPLNHEMLPRLYDLGWHPCNGHMLNRNQYPDLSAIIESGFGGTNNSFNAPDLRGYFTRGFSGVTTVDPDKDSRTPSGAGGDSGNHVGTLQGFATARPQHDSFFVSMSDDHAHLSDMIPLDNNQNAASPGSAHGYPKSGSQATSKAGEHTVIRACQIMSRVRVEI
ncbi:MAG: phage tail protein [Sedimenticola sp.]